MRAFLRLLAIGAAAAAIAAPSAASAAAPAKAAGDGPAMLYAAQSALADGLYLLAATNSLRAIESADSGADTREKALGTLCQALHFAGEHAAILAALDANPGLARSLPPPYGEPFWRASALVSLGRAGEALEVARKATASMKAGEGLEAMLSLEARSLAAAGDTASALAIFRRIDETSKSRETRSANLWEWAQALDSIGERGQAGELLARQEELAVTNSALAGGMILRARMARDEGDTAGAVALLSNVSGPDATEWATPWQRANALAELAGIHASRTNLAEAAACMSNAMATVRSARDAQEIGFDCGRRAMLRPETFAFGAGIMKEAVRRDPSGPGAAAAQLELADAYAANGLATNALAEYQAYLESYDDPARRPEALRGRALALFGLGQYDAAATSFKSAADAAAAVSNADMVAECRFREADSLLAQRRFADAAGRYAAFVADYGSGPLAARALFNAADAMEGAGETEKAFDGFTGVAKSFPTSEEAPEAFFRAGLLCEKSGRADAAIALYTSAISATSDEALKARAYLGRGRVRCYTYRLVEARSDLTVARGHAETKEDADFLLIRTLYAQKLDSEAASNCNVFTNAYPDSPLCADVTLSLAKFDYNKTEYGNAQKIFEFVADKWPESHVADDAILWAGRSAMRCADYANAVKILSRMARDYPKSPLLAEARFVQADALGEMARFEDAIKLLDEITARWPDSECSADALGRKGDCLFSLGTDTPARYDEAMQAYKAVLSNPDASFAQVLQAEFKIGRCLEKRGDVDKALEQYHNAVVARYKREGSDVTARAWFARAAFQIADICAARGDLEAARKILGEVKADGGPTSAEAQVRLDGLLSGGRKSEAANNGGKR